MYELFFNFLIEELLVRYFKKINVEPGDKFYIVIEDFALRRDFYKALHNSVFTHNHKICFPGYEKYGIGASEYDTVAFTCTNNGTQIIVSGCDDAGDGFQTMIRNNIGVVDNPISEMAALFILPGNNAIETLLSAGRNLQEKPYPLCLDSITRAICNKIEGKINIIEKEYLRNHVMRLRFEDDYTSLFDFAPVLSILQKSSLKGSFFLLDAFEDSEIYDNMFAATDINIKERVKDNASAFATISEMMSEAYEQDQYKRLCTYLDAKLASKISSGKVEWKMLDYKEIRRSHDVIVGNPTITRPQFKVDGNAELLSNFIGPKSEKTSKSFVIVCDPILSSKTFKACFNKELKDYVHGKIAKVSGYNLVFSLSQKVQKDKIGDEKNYHEVSVIQLQTKNVFQSIAHYFTIDAKGNIVVNVPDSEDGFTIGLGTNLITYDGMSPVELDDNSAIRIDIDHNATEEPIIPFKFGDKTINIRFKYKGEKTPILTPSSVTDTIWGKEDGGYTHDGEDGDITGTVNGPQGPVYIHDRFRKLASLEKRMIDMEAPYLYIEKNEFSGENDIKAQRLSIAYTIDSTLSEIFRYFKNKNTVPSFIRPDEELCKLYKRYIDAVHDNMQNIPTVDSFSNTVSFNIAKLGVVEKEDGTIMLSPFHPLMVSYALQMVQSVDSEEYNKKVIDELSPLYLMPYIYYGNGVLKAISSTETEDILTWVKYEKADNTQHVYGSKSTSKLITDKIKNFIDNFKYYFPDVDCPIRISAIGLSQSVDLIRGIVSFIDASRKKGSVQRIEIHEYVEDMLSDTFFEKLNRQSSRDNISQLFETYNFNVADKDLNEIIRLLFSRVSYYKHTFKDTRKMGEYSHVTFYKIDSGTNYTPLPANQLRTETSLDGLISIPSTNLSGSNYLMGFGTRGLKQDESPIYQMARDMNSLYANLQNEGLASYRPNQCTAKRYSFKDADFLQSVYDNSTWVTFVYPEVDIDFFYKQKNIYVVHYVEQHSISARLESITVTQHVIQYNKMLFNSLQIFKSIIGTSEDFSRKMISYFNCLNGKWLLDIAGKSELIMREKMSLVATCFVMKHFLNRTDNIVWAPIALDEIVRATGSIGITQDGLFSKKDLGLDGPISDDILMMGIRRNDNKELDVFFYPVEVKVLADDSVNKGEIQIANLYNKAFKEVLFKGDTFTRKVYRALFASQFLSNMEKMRANDLISDINYEKVNDSRYELLNVKFNIIEELPEKIGKAALVVYSDATPKSLSIEWVDDVPVCHIRMMESDCYRIVANPDSALLQFVEESAIVVTAKPEAVLSSATSLDCPSDYTTSLHTPVIIETEEEDTEDKNMGTESPVIPLNPYFDDCNSTEMTRVDSEGLHRGINIRIGKDRKGAPIIFEANNTTKVSHPNMGIVGGMGFGKTQFALSLIAQFAKESQYNVDSRPIGMLIFDYKGDDYSTEAFLNKVNGHCYSFNFPFNPLKLVVTDKTKFMNLPAVTADRISDSFAKAYGLGQVQQSTIKQVIIETYNDFGITSDPSSWNKPQPTMSNVVDKYFEQYDAKDKTYALFDKLRDYMIFTSDNSKCVSLFEWLDGVKVIDLTPYPGDTKKVIVSLILDLFYEEMRQLGASKLENPYRELRAMILVDEAHQFLNKDFNSFRNIISEGRMFGVGMILSTQNLSDFKSAKQEYSQFILSWVILHMNNITKGEVANIFGSNDPNCQVYVDIVSKAEKFYGICKIGNDVKAIRTLPYYELIKDDERFLEK